MKVFYKSAPSNSQAVTTPAAVAVEVNVPEVAPFVNLGASALPAVKETFAAAAIADPVVSTIEAFPVTVILSVVAATAEGRISLASAPSAKVIAQVPVANLAPERSILLPAAAVIRVVFARA